VVNAVLLGAPFLQAKSRTSSPRTMTISPDPPRWPYFDSSDKRVSNKQPLGLDTFAGESTALARTPGPQIESPMSTGQSDAMFVFPPAQGNAGEFKNHLGVAYLRAALAREGMATEQYLNEKPGTIDSVATDILRRKCPIVGFTVYDSNGRLCIALAQSIKRR